MSYNTDEMERKGLTPIKTAYKTINYKIVVK